ncbi:efflux RND transporter periplasmic adaptor subunit [Moritella viscosa]|uniref:Membrane-fusion protein n=1 Tax=Moritella viscosa TaxID=80854 RepID=A0A090K5S1_9GAMM|nr:membrane-fusion protein [Moritella viscosa]CED59133.1 putative secretion protein, HlyD family [Moritella viscosa]SGY86988.1 Membrane-fusion protein [Moritella viscosa]SGZ03916.1 Membrane-fusion protein [Moritella viscosa]SGZ18199.1 Membrane-fusion protein [Moritella viscosa]SHN99400.1 Membrane-fusion protein [Moritella viscosa]
MQKSKLMWLPIGVAAGLGIMAINNFIMKEDVVLEAIEPAHSVYVTQIREKNIAPAVKGYGHVVAKNKWQAISEVSGKVIYKNERLQRGTFINEGVELLRIDPTSYELNLTTAQANLDNISSEVEKLDIEEQRLTRSYQVESKTLALEKKEYQRNIKLNKKGTISASSLEQQERIVYNTQLQLNDLKAQINQLPARKKALQAQIAQAQSQIDQAQLDLENTIIIMPFNGRIIDVNAELQQFVSAGISLILAHDISKLEVEAKMPTSQLSRLVHSLKQDKVVLDQLNTVPDIAVANLTARITLRNSSTETHWQGKVTRILGEIDARLGTAGLVVETDFDFLEFIKRNNSAESPIISGMFVEVTVNGQAQPQLTVPLAALHNNRLYLMDKNNRLQLQNVDVLFIRDQVAAIKADGLQAGQQVVLSDIIPVSNGLKLAPTVWIEDKE